MINRNGALADLSRLLFTPIPPMDELQPMILMANEYAAVKSLKNSNQPPRKLPEIIPFLKIKATFFANKAK
ncbi:hypothetical protein [Photobacterium atrarenae]|uniref:Uncharacterized protein n=1 Tax=Photobacterium atrarenae TaxID=865757 RepID=A0ABY5GKW3_9GAMM|nr:hypothetical protein [Photobacterium atrarenae]UTV29364.1 hypothetical protein NNL38_20275 [Photobacterium atrarenae]